MLLAAGFRQRLRQGEVVFGPLVQIPSPALMEVFGLAGFDFVLLDREHGPLSVGDVELLARACGRTNLTPLVRVREHSAAEITPILDTGVAGIHVPHVDSPEKAESIVRVARFYPQGKRGLNPFVRAADYSCQPVSEFTAASNQEVTVVICVEGRSGLERLDEILSVGSVDVVFLGPYDISQSLGLPGEVSHPRVMEAVSAGVRKVLGRGLAAGVFASTVEVAQLWVERGVQYVVFSLDSRLCLEIAREKVQALRALANHKPLRKVRAASE
jgi:4-hydroxy-2-oxoheptanedioate aldolase